MPASIHPTAIVGDEATVSDGTRIWHWVHVRDGARIGKQCVLGQNVYVAPTVIIGDEVKVQNNVSLYDGVILEDCVFCGPSAVFTNVTYPRSEVDRSGQFETTRVGRGATIGANATILCGITIGDYAFIGAGSVVTKDVQSHALVVGNPARQTGWSCRCGVALPSPCPDTCCPQCGRTYLLEEKILVSSLDDP